MAPGSTRSGFDTERLLVVRVARPIDALFAVEEALKCRALSAVVAELERRAPTSPRRAGSSLAAREGGGLGLLLRHKLSDAPSAALTRWQVAAAPSVPDEFGGLGPHGLPSLAHAQPPRPVRRLDITWDHHERTFSALSVGVAAAASDRPDREALSRRLNALVVAAPVKGALRLSRRERRGGGARPARRHGARRRARDASEARGRGRRRAADFALLEAIADWCDRYTPLVGLDPPDGLMLDISGCAHLFGGEAALAHDLVRRLARARPAGARRGRRYGRLRVGRGAVLIPPPTGRAVGEADRVGIVPSGDERDALSPLPLAALRLPAETIEALSQVGLKRIADVLDRPRAPLAARFGAEFVRRLDQALGREDEPITPRLPLPAASPSSASPSRSRSSATCSAPSSGSPAKLGALLERRGEGARLLQAALFRTDGKVFRIEAGTSEPLREPRASAACSRTGSA